MQFWCGKMSYCYGNLKASMVIYDIDNIGKISNINGLWNCYKRVWIPLRTPSTAPMIKIIVIIYLFLMNLTQAEDFYEYTITILWIQDSFKLADNN